MRMPGNHVESTSMDGEAAAHAHRATEPARWLLDRAASDGVALTQTLALARVVVRDAVERWPDWWNARLFGPPHREADVRLLEELHAGLRRLRLVRRRGHTLHATARGRELAGDPVSLLGVLAGDLGGGEGFTESVAHAVVEQLAVDPGREHDELVSVALPRIEAEGWRAENGARPSERDVSWVVGEVLCRGEAYGVIERRRDTSQPRSYRTFASITRAGAQALGLSMAGRAGAPVLSFDAQLLGGQGLDLEGVRACVAVGGDQQLTALHEAIRVAFGWADDHLYTFWLDGRFWGLEESRYERPGVPDSEHRSAEVPLSELDLREGARISYVFDYGDEWRVELVLRERASADGGPYPRVLGREGTAPAQYPSLTDD